MQAIKYVACLVFVGLVSACGMPREDVAKAPVEDAPVQAVVSQTPDVPVAAVQAVEPSELSVATPGSISLSINKVLIDVPKTLRVSEANTYYPGGDIVWREDPIGDRHAQVKAIFQAAFERTASEFTGTTPVDLHVRVHRFHALTERARYTIGGVHAITFSMQLYDARNGVAVTEPREVKADLDAFGGLQAIRAENQGITQKSRITDHLAFVLRNELLQPGGHKNARLGLFQTINKF